MNKKIIILVVVLVFIFTGLIVAIYLRNGNSSPETNTNEVIEQAVEQEAETDDSLNANLQEINNDLNSIKDEDFSVEGLSDANIGL